MKHGADKSGFGICAQNFPSSDATPRNTLAMTQLMGANENAAHNYDEGAKALARAITKSLRNEEDSPRHPHWRSRTDLWTQYALVGAVYLSAHASVDHVAWPTLSRVQTPCLKLPFRSPRGPPEPLAPPCIRHRARPVTAACLQG